VAQALAALLSAGQPGVKVHERPPEIVNPPCMVIGRPQPVTYSDNGFGVDTAELPVTIVGGIETEDAIEAIKNAARRSLASDATLGGAVASAVATQERNWINRTGAGGIQLLTVELVVQVMM
jgi:hypothetical protein